MMTRSEIVREIESLGGRVVMHGRGHELVHHPVGSLSSAHVYARIRRLAIKLPDAPLEAWGVAILDSEGWKIVADGLSKGTATLYAEATTACGPEAIAVRRFQ